MTPPKDVYVEVKVLKQIGNYYYLFYPQWYLIFFVGEISTENGTVSLDKGTTQYLRRSDVEHLIRQGVLQHLDY